MINSYTPIINNPHQSISCVAHTPNMCSSEKQNNRLKSRFAGHYHSSTSTASYTHIDNAEKYQAYLHQNMHKASIKGISSFQFFPVHLSAKLISNIL
jgi:hypothetical protein